ncbi:MAG: hypothetical protein EOL98_10715 [Negativicutes bacterium]|nr:hypothetical protein [Negativicutes bacterium]
MATPKKGNRMKKNLAGIIIISCFCIAYTLVKFQIDFSGEEEFVYKFLQSNYNISEKGISEFSNVFINQNGSQTESDLEIYIKERYGKYFTQKGMTESIESKSIISNEFSLMVNNYHIESEKPSISKSTFYTPESPCYDFEIETKIIDKSADVLLCYPTGVIYLKKTFWGWKIDRFLSDYRTSVSFTLETKEYN